MDRITQLIAIARRQVRLAQWLEALSVGLLAGAILGALVVIAVKFVPGVRLSMLQFAGVVGAGVVVAMVVAFLARLRSTPADATIALRLDERLALDERLSTALALARSTDGFARAAVADAVAAASPADMPGRIRRAFPASLPHRGWWSMLALGGLALVQAFVPAYAWPAPEAAAVSPVEAAQRKASADAVERLKQELESAKALPQDVRDSLSELARNADPRLDGELAPEDERRETIRRMSQLQSRLDELRKSDEARRNEAVKRDLEGLEPQDGELSKFGEAMAQGDFAQAKEELAELAEKMQSGQMGEAEKKAAREALAKMAQSLEALAERQQSLKDELEKAGLDGQLASSPEALERAISENPNLSEQQREQLRKAAKAAAASQQKLKNLANAAKRSSGERKPSDPSKRDGQQQGRKQDQPQGQKQGQDQQQGQQQGQECENGSQSGQQGQQGQQPGSQGQEGESSESGGSGGMVELSESLSELGAALSELEITEQMLQEAEALAAMAEEESQSLGEGMCKGGSGMGPQRSLMDSMNPGQMRGMNGGRAQGGNTGKSKTPTGTKAQKAQTKTTKGDIIARQLIENPNPEVGESVIPSESVGSAVDGGSGAAVAEEQVPIHLEEAHKHYFGSVRRELDRRRKPVSESGSGSGSGNGSGGGS